MGGEGGERQHGNLQHGNLQHVKLLLLLLLLLLFLQGNEASKNNYLVCTAPTYLSLFLSVYISPTKRLSVCLRCPAWYWALWGTLGHSLGTGHEAIQYIPT